MKRIKEGGLRLLAPGEIVLARSVFRNSITWHKVWIHRDSYLPFGLQNKNVAMAPNGEIYLRNHYRDDFSKASIALQHIFIHELAHVWQRERGMNVRLRGAFSWAANYEYVLDRRFLNEYPLEQQAQIIADYFILDKYGYYLWAESRKNHHVSCINNVSETQLRVLYNKTLTFFSSGSK